MYTIIVNLMRCIIRKMQLTDIIVCTVDDFRKKFFEASKS